MEKRNTIIFDYSHSTYDHFIPVAYRHCTLNNFDFKNQTLIIPIIKNFIEKRGDKNGLYLYGGFGVGKTHLLVSMYKVIISIEDDVSIAHFISFENVIKELTSRIESKESTSDFIDYLCEIDYLFLDDITAIPFKDYSLEVLRKIINSRYEAKLSTCFSANSGLKSLEEEKLHPHAVSRIEGMCEIIEISGKDRRRS